MTLDTENDVSDITEIDDAVVAAATESTASADSSTAADANTPEEPDTLSILRDVVEKNRKPTGEAEASSATSAEAGNPAEGQSQERDPEDYSDVPFNKHPRFQEVLGQLKEAKTDAVRYRNVQNFMDDQGLAAEETAELMIIGGMMKRDPAAAWARIKPTIQNLLVAAGEVLPPELKQRVEQGELSREAAVELSRSQAQVQSYERTRTFDQQREEARRQTEHQQSLTEAASNWATDRKLKDPNFDAKQPMLLREIAYLQSLEGKPKDATGVKDQLKRAYDAVVLPATVVPMQRKQAITPVRGGQAAGTPQKAPDSTMDALNSILAARG